MSVKLKLNLYELETLKELNWIKFNTFTDTDFCEFENIYELSYFPQIIDDMMSTYHEIYQKHRIYNDLVDHLRDVIHCDDIEKKITILKNFRSNRFYIIQIVCYVSCIFS